MNLEDFIQKEPVPKEEKVEKPKNVGLFDFLKGATEFKTDFDFTDATIEKAYDQYMINRFLSMQENLIFFAEKLNTLNNLTNEDHYAMIKSAIPQDKYPWYNYVKGKKDLTGKEKRYIAHYFEIGLRDAHDYIDQMDDEEIEEILDTYRYGKNQMIKV